METFSVGDSSESNTDFILLSFALPEKDRGFLCHMFEDFSFSSQRCVKNTTFLLSITFPIEKQFNVSLLNHTCHLF
jgi:hypothetical protein